MSSLVPSAVSFTTSTLLKPRKHTSLIYVSSHLLFTYLFTILALLFLHRNWRRYIPLRKLFSLELAQSVPARTVMVTALPPHLRSERALADYFEGLQLGPAAISSGSRGGGSSSGGGGLAVESVVVTRATGSMRELLERRTRALVTLEQAWAKYLGNPVPSEGKKAVSGYEREREVDDIVHGAEASSIPVNGNGMGAAAREGRLVDLEDDDDDEADGARRDADDDLEARLLSPSRPTIFNPARKRPTLRPHWFAKKVDALDHYAEQFRRADEAVRKRRRGKFRPTGVAFVTFQTIAAAQVAAQVVHYPSAAEFRTELGTSTLPVLLLLLLRLCSLLTHVLFLQHPSLATSTGSTSTSRRRPSLCARSSSSSRSSASSRCGPSRSPPSRSSLAGTRSRASPLALPTSSRSRASTSLSRLRALEPPPALG